jgi:ABC-type nitrate/sulfonate/bicarbonate transport system permease component
MIRSVAHSQTSAWNRAHQSRHRRAWFIMLFVIVAAFVFWGSGYFTGVDWLSLTTAVLYTTYRLVFAYLIALVIGVSIALLVGWSPFADGLFPVFDILQNVPSFALIPFFIYFFGYTDEMIILFAVSSIVWPILFAVLAAIKTHTRTSATRRLSSGRVASGAFPTTLRRCRSPRYSRALSSASPSAGSRLSALK